MRRAKYDLFERTWYNINDFEFCVPEALLLEENREQVQVKGSSQPIKYSVGSQDSSSIIFVIYLEFILKVVLKNYRIVKHCFKRVGI